ncbi:MAG: NTP transferase domain-containing protein [Candidatus Latescibacterota bacterium]|nr:MAG: NTP transferase domain-containing protein [Candidatus Latescibacterota bacterium]
MHAVILAAGFGERMAKVSEKMPKGLLPIGGRALLDWVVTSVWVEPISKIHIVHNARDGEAYRTWKKGIRWVNKPGARTEPPYIRLVNNEVRKLEDRRGAVGDLEYVIGKLNRPGPLLVAFVDNIFPPLRTSDIDSLVNETPAITIRRIRDIDVPDELGKVHILEGQIHRIDKNGLNPYVFAGPSYISPESIPELREYCRLSREAELIPDDMGDYFGRIECCRCVKNYDGPFFDVGTPDGYRSAQRFMTSGEPKWTRTARVS